MRTFRFGWDRLAIAVLILSTCSNISVAGTPAATVGRIIIERRQVFDESDSIFISDIMERSRGVADLAQTVGRIANDVHVMTREEVIRRELLFKEGDPYDQRLVDESARHLRRLGFIGGVLIMADTLPDNTVNVTVTARDRWTLSPQMSLQAGGGVSGFGVGVREENLLGSGQKAEAGYSRLSDRTHPVGGNVGFSEPRLFGTWWSTSTQIAKADELSQISLEVQHPFYADAAAWATRGYVSDGRVRIRQYADGEVLRDDYMHQQKELFWLASSSGSDAKLQLAAAYYRLRSSFDSLEPRPFDNVDLVIASINLLGREYYKGSFIENFGRVEDVPEGYQAGLAVGRNLHFTRSGSVDYFARALAQASCRFGGSLSGNYKAVVTSYFIHNIPDEMTISASAMHYWRLLPDQTLLGRVSATIGSHWAPSSQLTLGSFSGLRGYRSNEFVGERVLVCNLEHRMFSLLKVWFLKLGTSIFFDSGVVWGQGEGFGGQKFHSAAGIGLQCESGKNQGSGIFRADIAYNMDRRGIALVLSSDHLFRAFSDMEFVPPIPGAEADQQGLR